MKHAGISDSNGDTTRNSNQRPQQLFDQSMSLSRVSGSWFERTPAKIKETVMKLVNHASDKTDQKAY